MTAAKPARIVDAHVHLWDPARTDWYPYLSADQAGLNMGDVSGMARRFDVGTYRAESAGWNVEKLVNVAAATGGHSVEETLELDRRADVDGQPAAIVGGLPPGPPAEVIAAIERQCAASRLRGVRPMGAAESTLPSPEVLRTLADRDLVLELMMQPDRLQDAARDLESHGDLMVVVEHAGWPRNDGADERVLWQRGIDALAGVGGNVVCKLSGLAMPLQSMASEVLAPWVEYAIDAFGVDRCLFASNFPVDGLHGTFDELYGAYAAITAGFDDQARAKLFAANAERVYRLDLAAGDVTPSLR